VSPLCVGVAAERARAIAGLTRIRLELEVLEEQNRYHSRQTSENAGRGQTKTAATGAGRWGCVSAVTRDRQIIVICVANLFRKACRTMPPSIHQISAVERNSAAKPRNSAQNCASRC
jgi:hypothetical protein